MSKFVLGIDIGGTNIRGAVIDDEGQIIKKEHTASHAKEGIERLIENLSNFINRFKDLEIDGIGIGIPGIMNSKKGILTQAPNIKGVNNFPIVEVFNNQVSLGVPIIFENDANSAAIGEYWKGAGTEVDSLVILTLGTGLGGGIILNGKLWSGSDGMAGEIGHMIVNPDGPPCNCGNNGCLESYVSAEALRRQVNHDLKLKELLKDISPDDIPEELMRLAMEGNKRAREIWKNFGTWLGIGIASITNLLNTEMVVIGGGISNAWDLFIEQAEKELKKRGLNAPTKSLSIERALLSDDAGIFGVSYLVFKHLEKNQLNQV